MPPSERSHFSCRGIAYNLRCPIIDLPPVSLINPWIDSFSAETLRRDGYGRADQPQTHRRSTRNQW